MIFLCEMRYKNATLQMYTDKIESAVAWLRIHPEGQLIVLSESEAKKNC